MKALWLVAIAALTISAAPKRPARASRCTTNSSCQRLRIAREQPKAATSSGPSSLLTGLAGYWPLSGDQIDVATGTHNGAAGGHTPVYVAGHLAPLAIGWNAAGAGLGSVNITSNSLATGTTFSVAAWVLTPNPLAYAGDYGTIAGTALSVYYMRGSGKVSVYSAGDHLSASALPSGAWGLVVITANGTTVKYYLNGVLDANTYAISPNPTFLTFGASSVAGNEGISGSNNTGAIQNLGIWTKELSQAEVTTLFNGGAGKAYPFN